MAYFTSEDEKLRENERLYAPVAVTAAELRRTIVVGGSVHDATAVVRGLTVRIWWAPEDEVYGWKWSVNGEGPGVWYPDVDMIFQYLADRWVAIEAEAKGISVDLDGNSAPDLRAALDRAIALLHTAEAQRDTAWGDITRIAAERDTVQETARERLLALRQAEQERDALKAKLGWAQDELSKVWTALRGLR